MTGLASLGGALAAQVGTVEKKFGTKAASKGKRFVCFEDDDGWCASPNAAFAPLISTQKITGKQIVASQYQDTVGPPAFSTKMIFPELME